MAYLGDLSSCGLFNPAIAIGLMSEGARGLPPLVLAQCLAMAVLLFAGFWQVSQRRASRSDSTSTEIS